MKRKLWIMLAAGVAGGALVVGLIMLLMAGPSAFSSRQEADVASGPSPTPPPPRVQERPKRDIALRPGPPTLNNTPLRVDLEQVLRRNLTLDQRNRELEGKLENYLNWVLNTFQGKYPIDEAFARKIRLDALTDNFQLHPDLASYLMVTPEENTMMNDIFSYTGETMQALENEHMIVSMPSTGRTVVKIPSFPEAGGEVREDLYAALDATLGTPRFDRLLAVSGKELDSGFHYFGEAEHTIIFETTSEVDSDGIPLLLIKDGWIFQQDDYARSVQATEHMTAQIPNSYAGYMAYLPEDYLQAFGE